MKMHFCQLRAGPATPIKSAGRPLFGRDECVYVSPLVSMCVTAEYSVKKELSPSPYALKCCLVIYVKAEKTIHYQLTLNQMECQMDLIRMYTQGECALMLNWHIFFSVVSFCSYF